jgi:hypothetical protein
LVLRKDFDECLTKLETRLFSVIGKTIGESVANVLNELIPQLRELHKPKDERRQSVLKALQKLTGVLKYIKGVRMDFQFVVDDIIYFF